MNWKKTKIQEQFRSQLIWAIRICNNVSTKSRKFLLSMVFRSMVVELMCHSSYLRRSLELVGILRPVLNLGQSVSQKLSFVFIICLLKPFETYPQNTTTYLPYLNIRIQFLPVFCLWDTMELAIQQSEMMDFRLLRIQGQQIIQVVG